MASESFKAFRERVGSKGSGTFAPDEFPPVGGPYTAAVAVALARETQAGNWRLRVKFKVDSGPHTGTAVWWGKNYEPDNENSVSWFLGFCEVLGVDLDHIPEDVDPFVPQEFTEWVAGQLAGRRAEIKVKEGKEFKGRKDPEVSFVNPLPADAPEPQAQVAAKGMAKVAGAAKPKPAGPPKPPTPPRAPSAARDSL